MHYCQPPPKANTQGSKGSVCSSADVKSKSDFIQRIRHIYNRTVFYVLNCDWD